MIKAKPKMVSGVLCRDKDNWGYVVFFSLVSRQQVELTQRDQWDICGSLIDVNERGWTLEDWKATYDLAPPRKGRAFEAELEL